MTTIINPQDDQPPRGLTCPKCGTQASLSTDDTEVVKNKNKFLISASCSECGHEWQAEFEPASFDQAIQPVSDNRELTTSSGSEQRIERPTSESEIKISELDTGVHRKANLAVIPLPIFWGIIAVVIILVGVGVWLYTDLQSQHRTDATNEAVRAAQVLVRATETAEARKTATQKIVDLEATGTAETRLNLAVTATVAQAATSVAATSDAEFQATSTAERVATTNAESTSAAQASGTATAETIATFAAMETATAEYRATSTAQYIATLQTQATSTSEWEATATAENADVAAIIATTTVEWRATATAEARATPKPPELNVSILGCDTGLDVTRGLGEVKNAWITVQNFGEANVHNVRIVLSANDEEVDHPDHEKIANVISPGYQYSDKLTVDSDFGLGTVDSDSVRRSR